MEHEKRLANQEIKEETMQTEPDFMYAYNQTKEIQNKLKAIIKKGK